jgi:hypothetical protein
VERQISKNLLPKALLYFEALRPSSILLFFFFFFFFLTKFKLVTELPYYIRYTLVQDLNFCYLFHNSHFLSG